MMSWREIGKIISIVYKPAHLEKKPQDHFSRVPLEKANLVVGHGIEGDTKGGHPTRQLNLMSQETLHILENHGFQIQAGQMGEQIIVSGLDLDSLTEGDHLQIGDAARIEITAFRSGCTRFEDLQGMTLDELKAAGDLGVMAKVVADGEIALGDTVQVISQKKTGD